MLELHSERPAIAQLADEQLRCYNRADLDGFCACYAEDVLVVGAAGNVIYRGMPEFRRRYADLFEKFRNVRAEVLGRLVCGPHAVEYERWSRITADTHETQTGELLVRYSERDQRIAVVEFLG